MNFLRKHIHSLVNLEKKIDRQDFILKQTHEKGVRVLHLMEELEQFIIKNLGEQKGQEYIETFLRDDLAFINSRISMNEFDTVEAKIHKIRAEAERIFLTHSKVAYAPR